MNDKMKQRMAGIMLGAVALTGLGALSTPASAYSVQGCQAPKSVGQNGYWRYMEQHCYVDYNWYEEAVGQRRDGYKKAYSWTENTISGAKQNFRYYNLKYARSL